MSYRVYDFKRLIEKNDRLLARHRKMIEQANKALEEAGLSPPPWAGEEDPVPPDDPDYS